MEPVAAFPAAPKLRICYRDCTALKVQIIYYPALNQKFLLTHKSITLHLWSFYVFGDQFPISIHFFTYHLMDHQWHSSHLGFVSTFSAFIHLGGRCLKVLTIHNWAPFLRDCCVPVVIYLRYNCMYNKIELKWDFFPNHSLFF